MAFDIVSGTLKKYEGNDEQVIIPDSVERIADYAFYGAAELKTVIFPDTVEEVGSNVFYDCENLIEIRLPDSLSFLGSAAFSRCANLIKVIFPDSLTYLPKITFFQCESLREVHLPAKLEKMSRACFEQCHSLKEIVLPDSVRVLDENVFDDCTSLETVKLNEGLQSIGDNVFFNCNSLKELVLPASLQSIGKGAFETRGKLKLTVPDEMMIHSKMLDNNWNMYWNFGVNRRYNGRNEDNYQLHDSRIANVNLKEWKPAARLVLALNYLETYDHPIDYYDFWISENGSELLENMVNEKRFKALNTAVENGMIETSLIEPYLSRIADRTEKAKLLEMNRNQEKKDDLSSLDLDDLF